MRYAGGEFDWSYPWDAPALSVVAGLAIIGAVNFPKIELHVHLEGTVRARTLLKIARRKNGVALPADTVEGLAGLYEFTDFAHFIKTWTLPTSALRTAQDFRQVVVDYAAAHPLPALVSASVACSVSTDDPAMFDTDLSVECAVAMDMGVPPQVCYAAGIQGALCGEQVRERLRRIGSDFDWAAVAAAAKEH